MESIAVGQARSRLPELPSWLLIVIMVGGHAVKHVYTAGFLLLLPEMRLGLGLSNAEIGNIATARGLAGGLTKYGPTVELSARDWTDELNNNLTTVFLCSKAVIPHMTRAKSGKIINFASVGALTPMPQMAAYNCAKAGVVALTKTLAQELKKFNICVNAIAPGLVQSRSNIEMMKPSPEDLEKKWVSLDAVAQVAIFLASDASDGITGQVIPVYGKGI